MRFFYVFCILYPNSFNYFPINFTYFLSPCGQKRTFLVFSLQDAGTNSNGVLTQKIQYLGCLRKNAPNSVTITFLENLKSCLSRSPKLIREYCICFYFKSISPCYTQDMIPHFIDLCFKLLSLQHPIIQRVPELPPPLTISQTTRLF